MKKRGCALALILTAALCLAGCASEEVAQNDVVDVSNATPDEASESGAPPVMVQTIINSGMPLQHESWKMAREGGMTYIERWPQGSFSAITRIGSARDVVITPQHTGHDLDAESYFIDEEFLCWLEWPGIPDAQDENWYVYLQKRDGSAPQLLDEGPYSDKRGSVRGNWLMLDYEDGNVIWVKPYGDFQIKLYRSATGETTELDRSQNMGTQVAIGENDAVWTKTGEHNYVTLMHCDLATGTVSELAHWKTEQEKMTDPVICGHYLLMIASWGGELCVYDLETNEWTTRVDVAPPAFDDYGMGLMGRPIVLDDEHVALSLESPAHPYQLPVLDLESGTVYRAESEPYTPLYVVTEDVDEETLEELGGSAICDIQPVAREYETNAVYKLLLTDNGIERMVQVVQFHW